MDKKDLIITIFLEQKQLLKQNFKKMKVPTLLTQKNLEQNQLLEQNNTFSRINLGTKKNIFSVEILEQNQFQKQTWTKSLKGTF